MTTAEVLLLVRDRIAPDAEIDAFILRLIGDEGFRRDCTAMLGADAVVFRHPFFKIDFNTELATPTQTLPLQGRGGDGRAAIPSTLLGDGKGERTSVL